MRTIPDRLNPESDPVGNGTTLGVAGEVPPRGPSALPITVMLTAAVAGLGLGLAGIALTIRSVSPLSHAHTTVILQDDPPVARL